VGNPAEETYCHPNTLYYGAHPLCQLRLSPIWGDDCETVKAMVAYLQSIPAEIEHNRDKECDPQSNPRPFFDSRAHDATIIQLTIRRILNHANPTCNRFEARGRKARTRDGEFLFPLGESVKT